jgi:hypothetical protein
MQNKPKETSLNDKKDKKKINKDRSHKSKGRAHSNNKENK